MVCMRDERISSPPFSGVIVVLCLHGTPVVDASSVLLISHFPQFTPIEPRFYRGDSGLADGISTIYISSYHAINRMARAFLFDSDKSRRIESRYFRGQNDILVGCQEIAVAHRVRDDSKFGESCYSRNEGSNPKGVMANTTNIKLPISNEVSFI